MPRLSRRLGSLSLAVMMIALGALTPARAAAPDPLAPYQPPAAPKPEAWPRERLVQFMDELIDFVYKNHVVTDPARAVYGMTYEFSKNGHPTQTFSLDAMHDGAWFMSALATAQRAVPEGHYLEKIQTFQVPFYTNALNHSDRLFPAMKPGGEDKKPFTHPVKGWLPRGWDDGLGYDRATAKPFGKPGYDVASNHLAQDLADALLNVWLTTRDPAVAEAIANLQQYRHDYFGDIPVVAHAAGVTGGRPELTKLYKFPPFFHRQARAAWLGLYAGFPSSIPAYCDDLAWEYHAATAQYFQTGEFPQSTAQRAAVTLLSQMACMEFFCDDSPWRYGFYGFDLQGPVKFLGPEGRLSLYQSAGKTKSFLYGGRGIQFAWVGAGVLPLLARDPAAWERDWRKKHPQDGLVRIVDAGPVLDGQRDEAYNQSPPVENGADRLWLLSDPKSLYLCLESERDEVEFAITPELEESATQFFHGCRVRAGRDGKITVVNDGNGTPLAREAKCAAGPGKRWTAEIRIPYAAVNGQAVWMNPFEFELYRVRMGDGRHVFSMLSGPDRVRRRLEDHVLGTIENWHQVWKERGVLPSAWSGPGKPTHSWEISDAGNYAHLIKTIALWLIYQQHTSEWEIIKKQTPAAPLPCKPLPASVLQTQGLTDPQPRNTP